MYLIIIQNIETSKLDHNEAQTFINNIDTWIHNCLNDVHNLKPNNTWICLNNFTQGHSKHWFNSKIHGVKREKTIKIPWIIPNGAWHMDHRNMGGLLHQVSYYLDMDYNLKHCIID
jgi:hypothetical protein